jgi:putative phage-type endonuclease
MLHDIPTEPLREIGQITKVKTASPEEWRELRSHYIGGSDAAAVVGLNAFSSPYSLWAEKTGKVPGFAGDLATEVGTFLEEFVAQKFAQETGKKVRKCNQSFLNSLYPFAIANIDREIIGEDAGLEIKTTDSLNLKKFSGGEYPANYYVQCVHYMAITGKKRWYLAVLIGNKEFKWFTIERDEAEIAALMTAEAEFWELVKTDTPPAVDGTAATTEAIKTIYAESDDSVCDLTAFSANLRQYMALKKQIKELETIADEAANKIKEFMGDSGGGECDGFKVSWKSQTRSTFDSKRFAKENPDIDLSDYYKSTNARVFRVSEIK